MNTLLSTFLLAALPLASTSPISAETARAAPLLQARGDSTEYGCTNTSFGRPDAFAWKVLGFDYHASYTFTTPAHQNSWGYVNFNLSNPALAPAVATCSAASSQLTDFFYGTVAYNCALPDGTPVGGGSGGQASFDFSRPSGLLRLNQTWTCSDQDPQYPITLWAWGNSTLSLDCETTNWQNPNWTIGQIYSERTVKCAPVDLTIVPSQMAAVA